MAMRGIRRYLMEHKELLALFGESIQDINKITKEQIDSVFLQAQKFYTEREYEKSKYLFIILSTVRPSEFRYIHGEALCFIAEEDFPAALNIYLSAVSDDPKNPEPHYYVAHCFLDLNKKFHALVGLRKCVALSEGHPAYKALHGQASDELHALEYELWQEVVSGLHNLNNPLG